jgi:hypothetical protein
VDITDVILRQHDEQRRMFAMLEEWPRDDHEGLAAIWKRLEILLETHAEAGGLLGTTEGVTYSPRDTAPPGLVAAGSPTAYDHVCRALASSAHLP